MTMIEADLISLFTAKELAAGKTVPEVLPEHAHIPVQTEADEHCNAYEAERILSGAYDRS